MSLSIIQEPLILQPINNPIPIVVSSDYADDVGYRYKLFIGVSGKTSNLITMWIYPDTTNSNYMIYDTSQILSDYIGSDNYWNTGLTFHDEDMIKFSFWVIGYIENTLTEIYTGSTFYNAFRGVKQYGDFWDIDDYMMDKGPFYGQFLTNWKEDRNYKIDEYATLKAFIGKFDNSTTSAWDRALFNVYDTGGTLTQYAFYPSGDPNTNYNDDNYGIFTIPFGPANLNKVGISPSNFGLYINQGGTWHSYNSTVIDENIDKYSIVLQYSGVTSWTDSSETLWINIDNDFYKHPGVQFMWLGELGNYETFTFRWLDIKSFKIDKEESRKNYWAFNPTNGKYEYKIGDRGRKIINVKSTEWHKCYSDWLTSEVSKNLMELYDSPEVYIIINGNLYPVVVELKEAESKNVLNNHLFNHQVEFTMAYEKLSNC